MLSESTSAPPGRHPIFLIIVQRCQQYKKEVYPVISPHLTSFRVSSLISSVNSAFDLLQLTDHFLKTLPTPDVHKPCNG